jgi:hypothetical protein
MNTQATSTTGSNGESTLHDLFALSDDQILDIAPESDAPAPVGQPFLAAQERASAAATPVDGQSHAPHNPQADVTTAANQPGHTTAQPEMAVPLEPPAWLAAQMKDPWGGEEAREFWNGVQQARSEAAAYRAAFASPEDARALKELYPGGVTEARATAERAGMLEEIDRAYFGAAGNSPEQLSASRAQLAQRMLREDPAAFREMVEAGIRVLQEAAGPQSQRPKTIASAVSDATGNASSIGNEPSPVAAQHAVPLQRNQAAAATANTRDDVHVAAYAAFERAANEDLERSVGSAIERTLTQALPVAQPLMAEQRTTLASGKTAQARVPALHERLATSIRSEVEKALQGDRQLGEQVAQILSSRRFDNDARAQVVRLIADRAQQLVPSAAKRVLNEWTQATLAAHHGRSQRADAASARADVAQASVSTHLAGSEKTPGRRQDSGATRSHAINYRKFSDEQILDM